MTQHRSECPRDQSLRLVKKKEVGIRTGLRERPVTRNQGSINRERKKKKGVKKEIRDAFLVLLILELSDFSEF